MDAIISEITSRISNGISGKPFSEIRVSIVGIGNPLRGDDGFGPTMIEALKGTVSAFLFDCGTAPENYIIPILQVNPDVIILLDSVDFEKTPGALGVFAIDEVSKINLSTHNISAHLITDFLKMGNENALIFMVGIQPKNIRFGEPLSDEVKEGIGRLKAVFARLFPAEETV